MKNVKKIILMACATMLTGALMIGCGATKTQSNAEQKTETKSSIEQIKKNGKLVLATGNYRPFEYHDEKTNEVVGYDIDVARKIAEKIGVPLEVRDMEFTSLIPSLQNGQANLVIAALYITDERKKVVDFADPYLASAQVIVVKDSSNIKSAGDLEGKVVGAKLGATSANVVQSLIDSGKKIQLKTYKNNEEMLADLEAGRLDAGVNDLLYQKQYNSTHPNLRIKDELQKAELGIAVQKGDTELTKVVNEVIKDLKESGEAESIYKKWIPASK